MDTDAQHPVGSVEAAAGRAHRTRRRSADAELRRRTAEGRHLPTVEQLLRGYPFASGEIGKDSIEFARALADWCAALPDPAVASGLAPGLAALRDGCTAESVGTLAAAIGAQDARCGHPELLGALLRCRLYLAHLGLESAAMEVATDAVRIAYFQDWETEGDGTDVVWQSLGWLLRSAYLRAQRLTGPATGASGSAATNVVRRTAAEFEARVRGCLEETPTTPSLSGPPLPQRAVGPGGRPIPERD